MFNNRHVAAIVIARGGSKGLPGKNFRLLLGKPVIAWSVGHALAAHSVDLVAVSSEDERIMEAARTAAGDSLDKVKLIARPAELAGDTARVDDVLRHAVGVIEHPEPTVRDWRGRLDIIVVLYGNVPVRRPGVIDAAVSILALSGCDSVQSFAPVGKCHPWWMYRMDGEGRVNFYDDHGVYRRQELPPLYVPDAAVMVLQRDVLMDCVRDRHPHAMFGRDRRGIVQPPDAAVDIDTELDLAVAEAMLRRQIPDAGDATNRQ